MASKIKVSDELICKIIELKKSGYTNKKIGDEVGLSDSHVARLVFAANVHGLDWLKKNPTLTGTCDSDSRVVAEAVETVIACNLPVSKARILFSVSERLLTTSIDARKTAGHPLIYGVVPKLPKGINIKFVKEYIAELNEGKGFRALAAEHRDSCKEHDAVFNEKTEAELFDQKVAQARATLNMPRFKPTNNLVEDAITLWQHGARPSDLSKLTGISLQDAYRIISFLNLHGADEYRRLHTMTEPGGFADIGIASITEFGVAYNLPDSKLSLIFKIPENRLKRMRQSRIDNGAPIMGANIAKLSERINHALVQEWISKHCNYLPLSCLNELYAYNRRTGNWTKDNVLFCRDATEITNRWSIYLEQNKDERTTTYCSTLSVATTDASQVDTAVQSSESSNTTAGTSGIRFGVDCAEEIDDEDVMKELDEAFIKEEHAAIDGMHAEAKACEELTGAAREAIPLAIISGSSTENRTSRQSLPERKYGNAKAEIKQYRPRKKNRRRDVQKAKSVDKLREAVLQGTVPEEYIHPQYKADYIKIISKLTGIEDLPKGVPAKEYPKFAGKRGRLPIIDIKSEGFNELPAEVRAVQTMHAYDRLLTLFLATQKKTAIVEAPLSRYVPKAVRTSIVIKAFDDLITENSDLHRGIAQRVLGIDERVIRYHKRERLVTIEKTKESSVALDMAILEIYQKFNGAIGVRRMQIELSRDPYCMCFCVETIRKHMRCQWLFYKNPFKRQSYSSYLGEVGRTAKDLLKRNFTAHRPDEKIVTDVTMIPTADGTRIYLSLAVDLFNNEIVSWSMSASPTVEFVVETMRIYLNNRPINVTTIIHSDQGNQYQHEHYIALLESFENVLRSMSRKGNSLDNGAMESINGRLKSDLLAILGQFENQSFETICKLIPKAIHAWNNERGQLRLKGLSPVEYKNAWMSREENKEYVDSLIYPEHA